MGGLALFLVAGHAEAFIDAEALKQNLKSIEDGISNSNNGLQNLLDELEQSSGKDASAYLNVTSTGKATTMWDVPKNAWFYSSVQALTQLDIASGYKDADGNLTGEYGPGNNVTHAEALKIAIGAAGINPNSCGGFLAHPQAGNHWAKQYVLCAQERGLGIASSTDLNASASRAEVLHYVLKAFGIDAPDGNPPFSDSTSHKYKNDIAYAYALEIVSGDDGKGTFRPNDPVNRAEVAKIVKLAIELL